MKKQVISDFILGILIAFTISILIVSIVMYIGSVTPAIPVSFICEAFILSILCSLINLIYRLDSLSFITQSILGYILTTLTIITCGLFFNWYEASSNKIDFIIKLFFIYSLTYLITWSIIWRITKAKKKELNNPLNKYKQKL